MTDYAKFITSALYSTNSDYSSPRADIGQLTSALTPSEHLYTKRASSTSEATLDLGDFTSITALLIKNLSSTAAETIDFTFHTAMGSTTCADVDFADANPDTITEGGSEALTWVTDGAEVGGYVRVTGTTSNDGTYLIQAAAEELLTLGTGEALSAETSACVLYYQRKNKLRVSAGGMLLFVGSVVPANDLLYDAASGTPSFELFVVGA